jgi:hypothetical protein
MKKESIIIHIGYHKCASTYLQHYVFPKIPANYIWCKRHIVDSIQSQTSFEKDSLIQWLKEKIVRKYKGSPYDVTILSHEELSGHPHGYKRDLPFIVANNLKDAFPYAKILIVIRHQLDYLVSLYTYRVAIKGMESRSISQFLEKERDSGLFEKLEYDRLIEYYMSLFGKEHVRVIPLELLKTNSGSFHEQLAAFFNLSYTIPEPVKILNESTKLARVIQFWRPINLVFFWFVKFLAFVKIDTEVRPYYVVRELFYSFKQRVTGMLNPLFKSSEKISIPSDYFNDVFLKRYADSNLRLYKLTGLNVAEFGYPMSPE